MVSSELDPIFSASVDLRSRFDTFVARLETEALGPLSENIFGVSLWQGNEQEREGNAAEYKSLVHAPSPR